MTTNTKAMTGLIREVRTCFNQLRTLAENLNADLGINPSMRAIMESLSHATPRTVPDLAQERGTSRQHVQKVINGLLDQDLAKSEENPDHKRSVLYLLTAKGEAAFTEVRQREAAPMQTLSDALKQSEITAATGLISRMNQELDQLINHGEKNDET
jgi:DNA-binding MarR family transcriptional regulator